MVYGAYSGAWNQDMDAGNVECRAEVRGYYRVYYFIFELRQGGMSFVV